MRIFYITKQINMKIWIKAQLIFILFIEAFSRSRLVNNHRKRQESYKRSLKSFEHLGGKWVHWRLFQTSVNTATYCSLIVSVSTQGSVLIWLFYCSLPLSLYKKGRMLILVTKTINILNYAVGNRKIPNCVKAFITVRHTTNTSSYSPSGHH